MIKTIPITLPHPELYAKQFSIELRIPGRLRNMNAIRALVLVHAQRLYIMARSLTPTAQLAAYNDDFFERYQGICKYGDEQNCFDALEI